MDYENDPTNHILVISGGELSRTKLLSLSTSRTTNRTGWLVKFSTLGMNPPFLISCASFRYS